jgi:hypothetical protein
MLVVATLESCTRDHIYDNIYHLHILQKWMYPESSYTGGKMYPIFILSQQDKITKEINLLLEFSQIHPEIHFFTKLPMLSQNNFNQNFSNFKTIRIPYRFDTYPLSKNIMLKSCIKINGYLSSSGLAKGKLSFTVKTSGPIIIVANDFAISFSKKKDCIVMYQVMHSYIIINRMNCGIELQL